MILDKRQLIKLENTLKVLNELEKKGLIERYAMGGGIAVLFYAEPVLTYDLDIFCLLPEKEEVITLSPIYEYLQKKDYRTHKEHIIIEGIPVQFIPAYNELVEEAIEEAIEEKFGRVRTRVVSVEHLLAIMLQTNRRKDRERISLLLDEAEIDMAYLKDILKRHRLQRNWDRFRKGIP